MRRAAIAVILLASVASLGAQDLPDAWLEVRTPHFTVMSDASEVEARAVASHFERVRAVFEKAFPGMRVYPDLPIVILAARDEASFRSLEPPAWLKPGAAARSGMMLRNPDKNYILLLMGVKGANPYHVVYHEYAHLVLEDDFRNIPLWLNEGLAQFYGNSEIDRRTVLLGLPSKKNLELLRSRSLLPLETLFGVDQTSPYYNEQDAGTIFYAESWALADYLMFASSAHGRGPIDDYLAMVSRGADPTAAAVQIFGNLDQLQASLDHYVARSAFGYYKLKVGSSASEDDYRVVRLSPAQSEAVRGDFMARTGNLAAARALLSDALRREPALTTAEQSMGLAELHAGDASQAEAWFRKAAADCENCMIARFYNALALMARHPDEAERAAIATALQGFIRFNPTFAPAYAALARFDLTDGNNLLTARALAAKASELEPRNVQDLFLEGVILLKMGDQAGALRVAQEAVNRARTPAEKSRAYIFLGAVQEKQQAEGGTQ